MKQNGGVTALVRIAACDEAYSDGHSPLAGSNGKTLRTFDKDSAHTSNSDNK